MVGFYATASESQELRLDLDNELTGESVCPLHSHWSHFLITISLDARWFTREEILAVLDHPEGTNFSFANTSTPGKDDPPFRVPPKTAIAGVLISDWAHGMSLDTHCASPKH
jgi:NAD+ diphosphatase